VHKSWSANTQAHLLDGATPAFESLLASELATEEDLTIKT
jgi:hypothetical protein